MNLPRPILNEFKKHKIKLKYGYLGETKDFHIRILEQKIDPRYPLEPGDKRWIIQFGYKPTFDRWANSTNFETEIWYSPTYRLVNDKEEVVTHNYPNNKKYTIPKLDQELEWCLKVATSGLFNWNSYFSVIKTPWFIHDK